MADIDRARAVLPPVDPDVFACYLGGLVRQVQDDSEADPIGILASLVCAAGVYLGPGPHVRAGDDRHPLLVWPLVIGRTNGGRKGASWATARRLLVAADAEFMTSNVRSGLTSGEGLAAMFTEPDPEPTPGPTTSQAEIPGLSTQATPTEQDRTTVTKPTGGRRPARHETGQARHDTAGRLPAGDRRLVVFEPEWAGVIAKMKREGNSLSATLRQAWEGGDLSTLTVTARIAPESHIGLLAHITPGEFKAKVSSSDLAGGTYNRFLPVAVSQARLLPGGTGIDPATVDRIGTQLRERLRAARRAGAVGFTPDGLVAWRHLYYEFGITQGETEAVEQFISRAAPYCLRLAALHAVLDGQTDMTAGHLAAAAALVRYSIASARAVFHGGEPARLVAFIAEAGPIGRTRTEITTGLFKNKPPADLAAVLDALVTSGRVAVTVRPRADGKTSGRQAQVFTVTDPAKVSNFRS
jgi:hypothetical protein